MPGEIQTSFIPKAPITASAKPAQSSSVGLMTVIGLVLALSSVVIFGGAFVYKQVLASEVEVIRAEIENLKNEMPVASLQEIERLDSSLNNAKKLLDNHVSSNRIFTLLQNSTIPTVRYSSFDFNGNEVSVKGSARTYEDIAAQARVFESMDGKITQADFSDFSVEETTKLVNFNLVLTVAPEAFLYISEAVPSTASVEAEPVVSTSTTTTTP